MESISEEAARWTVRAAAGPLSSDEQRELNVWLNADPRHRGAYVLARAQWVDLDRLAALHGPASSVQESPGISRRRLLAASAAAVTVGGGLSWLLMRRGATRYSSGIGEIRRIALDDGSTLLLNTATEVTVRLTKRRRDIQLVRGEALFEVAHDETRPFVVQANDAAVRAVGTAFSVRLETAQVDVTVTEGRVDIADSKGVDASSFAVKRVVANQRAVIASGRAPHVEPIALAEAERQLAWRDGMVSFDGESLRAAVAEINRHNRRQILVDDSALAAMPIVGVFRATDLDGFAATVAVVLKARAIADGDVIQLQAGVAQIPN